MQTPTLTQRYQHDIFFETSWQYLIIEIQLVVHLNLFPVAHAEVVYALEEVGIFLHVPRTIPVYELGVEVYTEPTIHTRG